MPVPDPTERPAVRSVRRIVAGAAAWLMSVAAGAGIIVRLTVQDHYHLPAIVFYMLSPASILGCAGFAGVLFWLLGRNRNAARMLLVAVACVVWVGGTMFHFHPQAERSDQSVRVLFWNVFRGHLGWDAILDLIHDESPDIVVLAETGKPRVSKDFWTEYCPDYDHCATFPHQVVVLSKYPIDESAILHHSPQGFFGRLQLCIDRDKLALIVCDLPGNPWRRRSESTALLTELAAEYSGTPAVIVGDMNTPVDSVYIDQLRTRFRNAFSLNGYGYHATWPMPLPVIAIDHCWVSHHIEVAACSIKWTAGSDHRPIVADLIIPATDDPGNDQHVTD